MGYQAREPPTREALAQVRGRETLEENASGVDLMLSLITTADLIQANIYARLPGGLLVLSQ